MKVGNNRGFWHLSLLILKIFQNFLTEDVTSGSRGAPGTQASPDPQIWRPQLYNLEAQCTI